MFKEKIAFIGAGNMAEAIVGGILESGLVVKDNVITFDIKRERLDYFERKFGVRTAVDNKDAVKNADVIVLSVKPQDVKEVLKEIKDVLKGKMVVSIAAGITTRIIEEEVGEVPVVRVMPNMPALIRKGMSVVSRGRFADVKAVEIALKIFQSVGKAIEMEERFLDIMTALSGSGPGYIFYIMEAMIKAGVKYGLPNDIAKTLVLQTVLGSAELALITGKELEELRKAVCSPGGTTLAILKVLEENSFSETLIKSVDAGYNRSKEISK